MRHMRNSHNSCCNKVAIMRNKITITHYPQLPTSGKKHPLIHISSFSSRGSSPSKTKILEIAAETCCCFA